MAPPHHVLIVNPWANQPINQHRQKHHIYSHKYSTTKILHWYP